MGARNPECGARREEGISRESRGLETIVNHILNIVNRIRNIVNHILNIVNRIRNIVNRIRIIVNRRPMRDVVQCSETSDTRGMRGMGVGKGIERAPSEASPIRQWLAELRVETQAEAMATMDGKALGGDGTRSWEDGDIQAGVCSSGGLVGGSGAPPACCALMRRARHVSAELARLFRRLEGARSHRTGGGHHPPAVEAVVVGGAVVASRGGAPWRRVHAGALRLACHARAAVTQMRATSPAASSQCAQVSGREGAGEGGKEGVGVKEEDGGRGEGGKDG
ncbi:unnamed protein product [Lampetra fluviatilis]